MTKAPLERALARYLPARSRQKAIHLERDSVALQARSGPTSSIRRSCPRWSGPSFQLTSGVSVQPIPDCAAHGIAAPKNQAGTRPGPRCRFAPTPAFAVLFLAPI